MSKFHTVSATGHRPDKLPGAYSDAAHQRLTAFAAEQLELLNPQRVVAGGALGWDTAVAQAALELGIPLLLAIPCEGQESRWPESSQARFRAIRARANFVHVVSPGAYSPAVMQLRNAYMVNVSDVVLAKYGTAHRPDKPMREAIRRRL